MKAWYYLHSNGELIHKRYEYDVTGSDFEISPFCKYYWLIDTEDRTSAWILLIEALALGANPERIGELAKTWGCTNEDADMFAARMGIAFNCDGDLFGVRDETAPGPFSKSKLEALAAYAERGDIRGRKRRI